MINLKYLDKANLADIESGMYNRALDPDVALYNLEFDDIKDPTFLETSLYLYQNEDGGFGHALDFDNVSPLSTVYQTYTALKLFKEAHVLNIKNDEISEEILGKAFKFLSKKMKYSLKEKINDKYACAIRFKGDDDNELLFGILGYTILFLDKDNKYYQRALDEAKNNIKYLLNETSADYLTLEQFKIFLQAILLKNEFSDVYDNLLARYNVLEKEYLSKSNPSEDYFEILALLEDLDLDEDELKYQEEALDALIDARKPHGMWENNKLWGNEDVYPEAMSSQLKWIGRATRLAVHYLLKYNRVK